MPVNDPRPPAEPVVAPVDPDARVNAKEESKLAADEAKLAADREAAEKKRVAAEKKDLAERKAEAERREAFDAAHPPLPPVPGTDEYQAHLDEAAGQGHPVTEGGDVPEPVLVTPTGRVVKTT